MTKVHKALLLGLALLLPSAARAADTHVVEREHYRLEFQGTEQEAEEAADVLEASWTGFEAHFGAAPKLGKGEKLEVRFYADRGAWENGIRADGATPPGAGAGGYYWPKSKTTHLYRQPTVFYTRVLLVHEATHQFHYLARTRNNRPTARWYREGVAEFVSWHRWDGERIELGVVPGVTLKDYPAAALKECDAAGFDLDDIIKGDAEASRAISWALYSFLATGDGGKPLKKFESFRKKMDSGGKAGSIFRKHFGKTSAFAKRFRAWLEARQTDWKVGFNEWEQIGDGRMRGYANVVSACRVAADASEISATLEVPEDGTWRGGLLLQWASAGDYTVALLDKSGEIHVNRRRNNAWERLHQGRTDRGDAKSHRLRAVRTGGRVAFFIDDTEIGAWSLPGRSLGLSLEKCDLRFRDVAWK